VQPGVPRAIDGGRIPFDPSPRPNGSTGRRLALARWLTSPDHPLTARVIVNRVWKHHFGEGIVASLDNFGALGSPPSHPQLLDYLAVEFVEGGWSLKRLHRLLMTSAAYRQSSSVAPEHLELDADNRLLSRMPMRRLDAEEVRDSLLLVAGRLSDRPFGPFDPVEVRKDGLVTSLPSGGAWRRSIYVRHRRKEMPTILEAFDLPQMNPNCLERKRSTVVSQPLHLLHNRMVHDLSRSFAERVRREAGDDLQRQIDRAAVIAWGRPPSGPQHQAARESIERLAQSWSESSDPPDDPRQQALADYCHALINSAAFLYVD
jgi:hypothetical protein